MGFFNGKKAAKEAAEGLGAVYNNPKFLAAGLIAASALACSHCQQQYDADKPPQACVGCGKKITEK